MDYWKLLNKAHTRGCEETNKRASVALKEVQQTPLTKLKSHCVQCSSFGRQGTVFCSLNIYTQKR